MARHACVQAILRTFRGVSRNFSAVFQELVPSGSGRMIMKTRADLASHKDGQEEGEDDDDVDEGDQVRNEEWVQGSQKRNVWIERLRPASPPPFEPFYFSFFLHFFLFSSSTPLNRSSKVKNATVCVCVVFSLTTFYTQTFYSTSTFV